MDEVIECNEFTTDSIRKNCKTCQKPKDEHPLSEEYADKIRELLKVFDISPAAKPNDRYAWTPADCPEKRWDEYFQKFPEDQIPRHGSEGQKNRLKLLARQIPLSDLDLINSRFADSETKEHLEHYWKKLHDSLKVGSVKEWCQGMPAQCPKCLLMLDTGELVVLAAKENLCFHPACFQCFQCSEALGDLIHCCDIDGSVFCVRHYSDNNRNRCHTCDELIFSARYSLAGEKFYHPDHLLCFACNDLLPLQTNKGYEKNGELYCGPCYEKNFCRDCTKCLKMITLESRHITYQNQNWHWDCFTCNKCDSVLSDSPFQMADEKFYCADCYSEEFIPKCVGCSMAFDAQAKVVKYEGKVYHVPCFKCDDCQESIGTGNFAPHNDRVYCKGCNLRNFGIRCFRCKYAITDEEGIMHNKEPYHLTCFVCYRCNTNIANKPFRTVSDNWYCIYCYGEQFCKKCNSCGKSIVLGVGEVLYAYDDYRWHPACFICSNCKKSLENTPFLVRQNELTCNECIKSKEDIPSIPDPNKETDQPETVAN